MNISNGIFLLLFSIARKEKTNKSDFLRNSFIFLPQICYASIDKWASILEKNGMIYEKKEGRIQWLNITDKGKIEAETLGKSHLIDSWIKGKL